MDASDPVFLRTLGKIKDPNLRSEIVATLRSFLLLSVSEIPDKRKFHKLVNKPVPSVLDPKQNVGAWSCHVTANDAYKASFTFEGGVMYMRQVDEHDRIDKRP